MTITKNKPKVKVIAPASGPEENFETLKNQIIKALPDLELDFSTVSLSKSIPYNADTDEQRLKSLLKALQSDADIIWCLRGGYGSARLIDQLAKLDPPQKQKLFIGYSDITALHLFLHQQWGWKTIHGSSLKEAVLQDRNPYNIELLGKLIHNYCEYGKDSSTDWLISYYHLTPFNQLARELKFLSGKLTGGNLTICDTSIGTSWEMNGNDRIILLEDLNEHGYRLDRTLFHMRQAGIFDAANAIVLGQIGLLDAHETQFALQRFADEVNIPVFSSQDFGHGYTNIPFEYGLEFNISLM